MIHPTQAPESCRLTSIGAEPPPNHHRRLAPETEMTAPPIFRKPTRNTEEGEPCTCNLPAKLSKSTRLQRSGSCRNPRSRAGATTMATSSRKSTPRLRRAAAAPRTADLPRPSTGAARTEEGTAATKSLSSHASNSKAPPAGTQRTPRLCTRRDPSIPRPPAAGAAAEGEESSGSPPAS